MLPRKNYSSLNILLVEDDHVYASMVMNYLNAAGYTSVRHSPDDQSCVNEVFRQKPDLVIMDYNLGSTNGIWLSQTILDIYHDMYIVFLSSLNKMEMAANTFKKMAFDYLMKDETVFDNLMPLLQKISFNTEDLRHREEWVML